MARVLSSSSLFKTLLSDSISFVTTRRGFAAAAESTRRIPKSEEKVTAAKLLGGKKTGSDTDSWVPDPLTGYYRPANRVAEVDSADLRARMIRPKA